MPGRIVHGPWSQRRGFAVLLAFIVPYVLLSAAHMLLVRWTVGFDAYLGHGPRMPPQVLIVGQAIKAVVLLGALYAVALRPMRLDWRAVGFVHCTRVWLLAGVAAALAGFALRLLLAKWLVADIPAWARFATSPYAWGDAPPAVMAVLVVMTVGVTPLAEEAFFRGFLLPWMATYRPLWLAMLAGAAMFGASHLVPAQAISAALMSLLIMGLYLGSRSIWPCIACHVLNNALGMGLGMAATAGLLPQVLTPPIGS